MAIALDTSTDGGFVNTGTSLTFSHTCSGSDRVLFVAAFGDTADLVTGATYNSVAMTLVGKDIVGIDRYVYLYVLFNPASGANNVVISASSSIVIQGLAVSYTGADQSGSVDSSAHSNNPSTSLVQSTTVVAANSWTVAAFRTNATTATAGTGSTERKKYGGLYLADSNGPLAAGSRSMTYDNSVGNGWSGVIASFAPATGGGGSTPGDGSAIILIC